MIVPLKLKTGQEVANPFSWISKECRPSKIWVENGQEFYNKYVQKLVELYSTENEEKSYVNEGFNRTIKVKMFNYFSANNARKCVGILDILVLLYNDTIHSSIKMTSKEASLKENENKVWRNLYPEFGGKTFTLKIFDWSSC